MEEKKKHTNNSGFTVPDKYFENFEKQLFDSFTNEKEGNPVLPKVKNSGFTVPDQYFENFKDDFLTEFREKKDERTTKIISIGTVKKLVYISGIAAMIVLAIVLWNQKQINTLDFESIALSDIQEYFSDENIEIDEDELAMLLDSDVSLIESFDDTEISAEVIEDYLSKEDLENDLYIE